MVEIIDSNSLNLVELKRIGNIIKEGNLVAYPTETFYGLGTNALDKKAIKRIYRIKKRSEEKKLTVIVSDLKMASEYSYLSEDEVKLCKRFMPGPLTILAKKKEEVPKELNDKFGFRISSNGIARKLSKHAGVPIVATSANVSGNPPVRSINKMDREIKKKIDVIIDDGVLKGTSPSTIIDLSSGELKMIREGPIKKEKILKVLRENESRSFD